MKWVAAKRRIGKVGERGDCCCTCILLIGTVSKSDEDDRRFTLTFRTMCGASTLTLRLEALELRSKTPNAVCIHTGISRKSNVRLCDLASIARRLDHAT